MAQGFPDYFGELTLPVSQPNGGTGAQSLSAAGLPQLVASLDKTLQTTEQNFTIYTPTETGFYILAASVELLQNSVHSSSFQAVAAWIRGGNYTHTILNVTSSAAQWYGDATCIGMWCLANEPIQIAINGPDLAVGDSYEIHARLFKGV